MDTSGFYKLDGDLLYGPNFVLNKDYELYKEQHETYTYPVDGWYWFDSEELAKEFFGIPIEEIIYSPWNSSEDFKESMES